MSETGSGWGEKIRKILPVFSKGSEVSRQPQPENSPTSNEFVTLIDITRHDTVENRKSLKAMHDAVAPTMSGDGSAENPFTTPDGENSYIGIYALVESVTQQRPVYVEVSGVKAKVENDQITYVSGESNRPFRSAAEVVDTLKSPTNAFVKEFKEYAAFTGQS